MIRYRLYTEYKGEQLTQIVASYFDGFTIIPTIGYWQGDQEQSCVIELYLPKENLSDDLVRDLVEDIKEHCQQACVLVVREVVEAKFV